MSAPKAVLDTSSWLALIRGEVGWNRVAEVMSGAVMCSVNVAEVYTKLAEWNVSRVELQKYQSILQDMVVPFDADLAFRTGALRPLTRKLGLALGDRACLALAQRLAVPAITADRPWGTLDIGIAIEVIR